MTLQTPPRTDHWPAAALSAAVLSGTLVRCGPGYRPVSWPETPVTRCVAIAAYLTPRLAAIEETAAWIWGFARSPGTPLRFLARQGRAPASFEQLAQGVETHVSQYKLHPGDIELLGGYAVTSRARTAYDLLRSRSPLTRTRRVTCRLLLLSEPRVDASIAELAAGASRADSAHVKRRLTAL